MQTVCVKFFFFFFFGQPGALYPDGTSNLLKMDDAVPPGGSYTYRWEVRPEFAPTHDDAECLTWVYHSHLDAPKDIAAGLIGPLLTCKKGRRIWFCFRHFRENAHVHVARLVSRRVHSRSTSFPRQEVLMSEITVSTISP